MKRVCLILALVAISVAVWGDSLSTLFSLGIYSDLKRVSGISVTHDIGNFRSSLAFADGTATDALEVNARFYVRGEVSSSSPIVYDLGSLTSSLGASFAFSRIKCLSLKNLDETDSIVLGSGTTPWKGDLSTATVITISPLGIHLELSPYSGLDASVTNRLLTIGSTGLASFDLLIDGIK